MEIQCKTCEHNEKTLAGHRGPWSGEPNRLEFKHAGFNCLLHRGGVGAWCGYVAVPPAHPAHGKDDDLDVSVHGGLTYAAKCRGHICHVAALGEPDDVWWLGFDCCHCFDMAPHTAIAIPSIIDRETEHYWTMAEAKRETESLAEQLAAMK